MGAISENSVKSKNSDERHRFVFVTTKTLFLLSFRLEEQAPALLKIALRHVLCETLKMKTNSHIGRNQIYLIK